MSYHNDFFEYTKEFSVSSSVIDEVYFNENDNTLVLDVNNYLYLYNNVNHEDVAELVKGGDLGSVGGHYNTVFKDRFGPSKKLGYYAEFEPERVTVVKDQTTATTPKSLVDISGGTLAGSFAVAEDGLDTHTKEHSFNVFDQSVSGAPIATEDEPTKEYSLNSPVLSVVPDLPVDDEVKVTVHFTLDDYDKKFKFVAESPDPYTAVDELRAHVRTFGATGRVSKVVIKFV